MHGMLYVEPSSQTVLDFLSGKTSKKKRYLTSEIDPPRPRLDLTPVYAPMLVLVDLSKDDRYRLTAGEEATLTRMLIELYPAPASPEAAALLLHLTSPLFRGQRNKEAWRGIIKLVARLIQDGI